MHRLLGFVTPPVKSGFLNALSILVFRAQFSSFYPPDIPGVEDASETKALVPWGTVASMLVIIAVTIGVNFLPWKRLPLGLISIFVATGCEWALRIGELLLEFGNLLLYF